MWHHPLAVDVSGGGLEPLRVVVEESDATVAPIAEKATYHEASVAVVHLELLVGGATDSATSALLFG